MGIKNEEEREKNMPLTSFNCYTTYAIDTTRLPIMVTRSIVMTNFVIVDALFHNNVILGKPWIQKMSVIPSTNHEVMNYPIEEEVTEIKGDENKERECYNVIMKQVSSKIEIID